MESLSIRAVVGAPDPERAEIIKLLDLAMVPVHYACVGDSLVHPGNAYLADRISPPLPDDSHVWRIECDGPVFDALAVDRVTVIDHHRPGDPGYGRPPAEFLEASSIGQVISLLARLGRLPEWFPACFVRGREAGRLIYGWAPRPGEKASNGERRGGGIWTVSVLYDDFEWYTVVPLDYIFAAAADHCLAAAYRGECPGVDPDALMRWRIGSRADFQKRPAEAILADVEAARGALHSAPKIELGPGLFAADLRTRQVPELPEAAARDSVCFLASVRDRDGRTKLVCQAGSEEQIRAFLEHWGPQQGLAGLYGDPARGFAGGYIT